MIKLTYWEVCQFNYRDKKSAEETNELTAKTWNDRKFNIICRSFPIFLSLSRLNLKFY